METFSATCHTDGCTNAGEAIELGYYPDDPPDYVVCGVCGEIITDTTLPAADDPGELP